MVYIKEAEKLLLLPVHDEMMEEDEMNTEDFNECMSYLIMSLYKDAIVIASPFNI